MTEPGWYNDERDATLARWHDGSGWTEHTMDKGSWTGPGTPPPPKPAPGGLPLGRRPDGPPSFLEPLPPPGRPPRSHWERPSGHFLAALVSLITIGVCLLLLQRIDESKDEAAVAASTTTTLPSSTATWQTVDGSTYEIVVTPSSAPSDQASTSGCIGAPHGATTNLGFTVKITNTSIDREAPTPQVAFGVNVGSSGAVDPAITTLDDAKTTIEVGPVAAGTSCTVARGIPAGAGGPLGPGTSADYTGVVGGAPSPVPDGLALIVRYFQADAAQVARGTGFSAVDLVVPFPKAAAKT
jgi:hypothetical protein